MSTFLDHLTVKTAIGVITAKSVVAADGLLREQVSLQSIPYNPELPPGMRVNKCTIVLLKIAGQVELERIDLILVFETTAIGGPCSGQCLDAQEWSKDGQLVVMGTEDGEALSYRFKGLGLEDQAVTEYSSRGMHLKLGQLGAHKDPSFHFVIAENNDPEAAEDSAWFAVDQNHEYLLKKI
ncbi:MAG: hypothetical protein AAGK71_08550 [Pseudomonadota bacterium]